MQAGERRKEEAGILHSEPNTVILNGDQHFAGLQESS
jgi:hypothetical protein